jgi:two-component system, NarL family, sensor kinase
MAGPSQTQAYLIFAIGTAGMLFMASAIILFVVFYQKRMLNEQLRRQTMEADYQRKMLAAQIESQEQERTRIAKDLHDDVGLMIQALRITSLSLLKDAPEESRKEVQEMASDLTESVRKISWNLMPSSLERFGLTSTVEEMCNRLSAHGAPVGFLCEGNPSALAKNNEVLLYRMAQEMVNNSLKHAKASQILVKLIWNDIQLLLSVVDNGIGFDMSTNSTATAKGSGLGLMSLHSRAHLLGATISFERNVPSGTSITILLPLKDHVEN